MKKGLKTTYSASNHANLTKNKIKLLKKTNIFYIPFSRALYALDNIYITTKLSRSALLSLRESLKSKNGPSIEIELPTSDGREIVKGRKKSKIVEILKKAIRTDTFANSLVSAVATTEGFLEDIAIIILKRNPNKLTINVSAKRTGMPESDRQNSDNEKTVPLKTILEASSIDDVLSEMIEKKLLSLLYLKPKDYFGYFEKALQITFDDDLTDSFTEIKATRDLIIHNGARVNKIYMHKSGEKGRAKKVGQNIPLSEEYFLQSISTMKKLVRTTYECCSREYLKKTKRTELYP